ncbi:MULTISPECIES: hypothetical protein [unclassified Variovorax]|uniref:DUF7673 family protein n=1 Tax=unclassified Variovorax TaxID=663243 RepID=UPI00210CBD07|nr:MULTISPECIES: hypothetical protein [unclassified Variovorax]
MATIEITLSDQLALLARSAGLLTGENIERQLRQQLAGLSAPAPPPGNTEPDRMASQRQALARLIALAQGDSDQSRRAADFLLAWWNAGACGSFDLTALWAVDPGTAADMVLVLAYIASTRQYPDALGYEDEFLRIVQAWRPELT